MRKPPSARAVFGNIIEKSLFYFLQSSRQVLNPKPKPTKRKKTNEILSR